MSRKPEVSAQTPQEQAALSSYMRDVLRERATPGGLIAQKKGAGGEYRRSSLSTNTQSGDNLELLIVGLLRRKITREEFAQRVNEVYAKSPAQFTNFDMCEIADKNSLHITYVCAYLGVILSALNDKVEHFSFRRYNKSDEASQYDIARIISDFVKNSPRLRSLDVAGLDLAEFESCKDLLNAIAASNIEKLDLTQNAIDAHYIDQLANMIASAKSLESLLLSENIIIDDRYNYSDSEEEDVTFVDADTPSQKFIDAIKRNKSLQLLEIEECDLLDENIAEIVLAINSGESFIDDFAFSAEQRNDFEQSWEQLSDNHTIKVLRIAEANLTRDNSKGLMRFLRDNNSLRIFDLSQSTMNREGFLGIFAAAATNKSLQEIHADIDYTEITSYMRLTDLLQKSNSLKVLSLSFRGDKVDGANEDIMNAISTGLQDNRSLCKIILRDYTTGRGYNKAFDMTERSAKTFYKMVEENKNIISFDDGYEYDVKVWRGYNTDVSLLEKRRIAVAWQVGQNAAEAVKTCKEIEKIFQSDVHEYINLRLNGPYIEEQILPRLAAVMEILENGHEDFQRNHKLLGQFKEYVKGFLSPAEKERIVADKICEIDLLAEGLKKISLMPKEARLDEVAIGGDAADDGVGVRPSEHSQLQQQNNALGQIKSD